MEDKPKQQAINYILRAKSILLVTHEKIDGDGLGSGLALHKALSKLDKKITFISFDDIPNQLRFLPNWEVVTSKVPVGNDFLISLDCTDIEVDKLRYNKIGDRLNILISPKSGTFTSDDVSFRKGQSKYDLVIALDCGDINQIGKLRKENIDLFYDNVVVNIDHHVSNDHFGKINLVDPTATSTAEIILSLLDSMQAQVGDKVKLMDPDIATSLLTGITVDTNSFQNQNTSPKAFSVSAQLLAAGARQQEIIKNIYKTHDISTLKLWGMALSNLKYDSDAKIVWTIINKSDFENSKAEENQVEGLMDELITSAPGSEIALLLRETENGVFKASLRSLHNAVDVNEIAKMFKGGGHKKASGFKIQADSVEKMENFVLKKLFEYQLERFNKISSCSSVEMEEDTIMKVPSDSVTREFVSKVREQAKKSEEKNEVLKKDLDKKMRDPFEVEEKLEIIDFKLETDKKEDVGIENRSVQEEEQKIRRSEESEDKAEGIRQKAEKNDKKDVGIEHSSVQEKDKAGSGIVPKGQSKKEVEVEEKDLIEKLEESEDKAEGIRQKVGKNDKKDVGTEHRSVRGENEQAQGKSDKAEDKKTVSPAELEERSGRRPEDLEKDKAGSGIVPKEEQGTKAQRHKEEETEEEGTKRQKDKVEVNLNSVTLKRPEVNKAIDNKKEEEKKEEENSSFDINSFKIKRKSVETNGEEEGAEVNNSGEEIMTGSLSISRGKGEETKGTEEQSDREVKKEEIVSTPEKEVSSDSMEQKKQEKSDTTPLIKDELQRTGIVPEETKGTEEQSDREVKKEEIASTPGKEVGNDSMEQKKQEKSDTTLLIKDELQRTGIVPEETKGIEGQSKKEPENVVVEHNSTKPEEVTLSSEKEVDNDSIGQESKDEKAKGAGFTEGLQLRIQE